MQDRKRLHFLKAHPELGERVASAKGQNSQFQEIWSDYEDCFNAYGKLEASDDGSKARIEEYVGLLGELENEIRVGARVAEEIFGFLILHLGSVFPGIGAG